MGEAKRKQQIEYPVTKEQDKQHNERDVYLYKDSGISERTGYVPFWLIVVAGSLLTWGVYYAVRYWSGE